MDRHTPTRELAMQRVLIEIILAALAALHGPKLLPTLRAEIASRLGDETMMFTEADGVGVPRSEAAAAALRLIDRLHAMMEAPPAHEAN